jgi:hypothetical protein
MKKYLLLFLSVMILYPYSTFAHHGGVSLAFGPGTPVETTSPLSLPQGGLVLSARTEYVDYQKFSFADPANKEAFLFNHLGVSYGVTNYLTASLFVPYTVKRADSLGTNKGLGDVNLAFQLGFNHTPGKGFSLSQQDDTALVSAETKKTFFSLMGCFTLPTGENNKEIAGAIDKGMQTGFGNPSYTIGFSSGRPVTGRLSLVADTSYQMFTAKDDFQYGSEYRLNVASVGELYSNTQGFLSRLDAIIELNLLQLSRDQEFGEGLNATGGTILYVSPGMRFAFPGLKNANLGILFKFPAWKNLNEGNEQQGSEGRENYRAIAALSFYF